MAMKKAALITPDVVDQLGQESDKKAKPVVEQVMKVKELVEKEEENKDLEILGKARSGRIVTYNRLLAELLLKRLTFVDFPSGWLYEVAPDDVGVIMELRSPDERVFRAAFKPIGEAKYDLNAIETYAVRAENTIDRVTNKQE